MTYNRSKLLEVSLNLFSLRGYEAVGIQEIVDTAGVTKPTLYHYFGSKTGLLTSLLRESFSTFLAGLQSSAEYQHDVTNSLMSLAGFYIQFARQHPLLYRFFLNTQVAPPESELYQESVFINVKQQEVLQDLFIQAAGDHGNMKGRHVTYAASFLGLVNTYTLLVLNNEIEPEDSLVHKIVHQFMHGIFS